MDTPTVRCLILACGNTLRGDDGIGPLLCTWAEERFAVEPGVRAIAAHQWSPEMAEDVAAADTILFIDCALDQSPAQVQLRELSPAPLNPGLVTHHVGAAELLQITFDLYGKRPARACLLTVGAASVEVGEGLSSAVREALPDAQSLLELTVRQLLR